MGRTHRTTGSIPSTPGARLLSATVASGACCATVVITAGWDESRLGAPVWWTWVLTGIQVVALWSAGARRWWGWLLGAAAQPPWIAYALVTGQLGFVPGCLVSAAIQAHSYVRWEMGASLGSVKPRRAEAYG